MKAENIRSGWILSLPMVLTIGLWMTIGLWILSGSAAAQSVTDEAADPDDGFVHPAVQFYADEHSLSPDEARLHLDRIGPLQRIMASIRELESSRVAGWNIDHGTDFRAWVWLTGDEPPGHEAAVIAAAHDDVEIRLGARHSYKELMTAQDGLDFESKDDATSDLESGSDISDLIVFTGIDFDTNSIKIGIDPSQGIIPGEDDHDGRAKRAATDPMSDTEFDVAANLVLEVLQDQINVEVNIADGRGYGETADFIGGEKMTVPSVGFCTSGFVVKRQITGNYGIITAGHCFDNQTMNGVKVPFEYGWDSRTADAQFHRVPLKPFDRILDDYQCSNDGETQCDVTGTALRKDMIGDYVCLTGTVTGVSCGKITSIHYKRSKCFDSDNKKTDCANVAVTVRGKKLKVCGGDSGGPIYNIEGVAYGILTRAIMRDQYCPSSGSTWPETAPRDTVIWFSAIEQIEEFLDVKILTEDPPLTGDPRALKANIGFSEFSLSWSPPFEQVLHYLIHRRLAGSNDDWELIETTLDTSYLETDSETFGKEYDYRVQAVNIAGLPSPGSQVKATIPTKVKSGCILFITTTTPWDVRLSWEPAKGPVQSYEISARWYPWRGEPPAFWEVRGRVSKTRTTFNDDIDTGNIYQSKKYDYCVKPIFQQNRNQDHPTNLRATTDSDGVFLTWEAPDHAEDYIIYRMGSPDNEYQIIARTTENMFLDPASDLTPGVEYYYRVKAVNYKGVESSWVQPSDYANVTIQGGPRDLKAVPSSAGISLTWTSSYTGKAQYAVYRRPAVYRKSVQSNQEPYRRIATVDETTYLDPISRLTPGVEYYYRVKAVDRIVANGEIPKGSWSKGSEYVSASIPAVGGIQASLVRPGFFRIFPNRNYEVELHWNVAHGDITDYIIYRRLADPCNRENEEICKYQEIGRYSTDTYKEFNLNWEKFSHHIRDPEIVAGREFYYRITAIGTEGTEGGWGTGSNYASASLPAIPRPRAKVESGKISLTWRRTFDGSMAQFVLYRRRPMIGEEDYIEIGRVKTSQIGMYLFDLPKKLQGYRFYDNAMTPGTEHYYRLTVVNYAGTEGGWGSRSNYARVVIPAVGSLSAEVQNRRVRLSWEKAPGDVTEYVVYRRRVSTDPDEDEEYHAIARTSSKSYSDSISGLIPGAEYYYRVKAVDSEGTEGGWGSRSNYARAIIPSTPAPDDTTPASGGEPDGA